MEKQGKKDEENMMKKKLKNVSREEKRICERTSKHLKDTKEDHIRWL